MGDKGSRDKGKREKQKKALLTPQEKRKLKRDKKGSVAKINGASHDLNSNVKRQF